MKPTNRAGRWYLIRRVPRIYEHLDKRRPVRIALGISVADDPRGIAARRAAAEANAILERQWADLAAGRQPSDEREYQAAKRRARAFGFDYAPADDLKDRAIAELLARIEALERGQAVEKPEAVAAVLGGVDRPAIRLSGLFEQYEAAMATTTMKFSPNQLRKWRNPKILAAKNFIEVNGDKALHEITRNDALDFRDWLAERVLSGAVKPGTANKEIGHLSVMFNTMNDLHRLNLQSPFARLRFADAEDGRRAAYPAEFVQARILADGALDGINAEARRVLYVMADTGMRLSEVANLMPGDIHLDAPIPYVAIRANGRTLKTPQSARDIPLVGVALAAMRAQPRGFPNYRDNADALSALLNKALEKRGLRPAAGQSLYSLRHTFEDRLKSVEADEKTTASLMGHQFHRPLYGNGPTLAQKLKVLAAIAFTPPSTV